MQIFFPFQLHTEIQCAQVTVVWTLVKGQMVQERIIVWYYILLSLWSLDPWVILWADS